MSEIIENKDERNINYNITINTEGGFGGDMDKFAREIIWHIDGAKKAKLLSEQKNLNWMKKKFWKFKLKKLKQWLAKFI